MTEVEKLAARDALAAQLFPERWAKVANVTGKAAGRARHNMRRQAEVEVRLRSLRAEGASCANCDSFSKAPFGFKAGTMVCDAESGGGAYQLATADGLCTQWRRHPGRPLITDETAANSARDSKAERIGAVRAEGVG